MKLYAAQIVHTLEYLQKKEIMHRDLKPQNLMLDDNYNIKFVSLHLSRERLCVFRLTLATRRKKTSRTSRTTLSRWSQQRTTTTPTGSPAT